MELDEQTLDGHWATNSNTGMEFFIINDAIFSKLCILGEDVEPCFEGARITAPEVSTSFTKMDEDFKKTLYTMMQDLKYALKGGYKMELEDKNVEAETVEAINEEETTSEVIEETVVEENSSTEETSETIEATQEENKEDEPTEEEKEESAEEEKEDSEDNEIEEENVEDYSLLKEKFDKLSLDYAAMEKEYQELVTFKEAVENQKKDALINSFYMLSDEDKKDVVENKSKYSYEDIEAKLSVICFRKKINFDLEDSSKEEETKIDKEDNIITYSVNSDSSEQLPAWVSAIKRVRDSKNN